jgi:hypothetical protein
VKQKVRNCTNIYPEELSKFMKNLKITGFFSDISIAYFLNPSQVSYQCANLFGCEIEFVIQNIRDIASCHF